MNKKRFPILVMMLAFMLFGLSDCDTECCESQRFASVSGSESKITLHFNANGGRAKMKDMIIDPDKDIVLPLCTFIPPDGKKFAHWNIMPNDSGNITLADGGTFNMSQIPDSIRSQLSVTEITLYAIWTNETVVYKYTVSFDANGGSGTMADMTADDGQSVALPLCTFTPPAGKKFGHWNITADDSGMIKLPDGAAIDSLMSLPVTRFKLYAIWIDEDAAPIVYTIHFDANGGSGAMSDMTADSSQSIALPLCSFTPPTGKRFGHWNINANDSGLIKLPDGASAKSLILLSVTDIRLYAIWIDEESYSIIYNNTVNTDNTHNPTSYKESDTIVIADLTADGWTFDGWFDASADGAKVIGWSAGERTDNISLWARWTVNTYTVTLSNDGNVHGDASLTATFDEILSSLTTCPSKVGYDFGGYWTSANGTGTQYIDSEGNGCKKWDLTSDTTLTAFFLDHGTHQIVYVNNINNAVNPNPTTFKEDQNITLDSLSQSELVFWGWYDAESGGKKVSGWNAGEQTGNITLYAMWNGITDEGDIMIMNEICTKTGLKQVMSESVTVTGSDENWSNSYYSGVDDKYKGVFVEGRTVKISPYKFGKYPVTQQLYEAVMNAGKTYDHGQGDNNPAYYVSWYDAITFCNKLSLLTGKTPCYSVSGITDWVGLSYSSISTISTSTWKSVTVNMNANGYRLPTEAEWEFAARGGDPSKQDWKYAFSGIDSLKLLIRGAGSNLPSDSDYSSNVTGALSKDANLEIVSWFQYNSSKATHPVGEKTANRLGIYDMSGNMKTYCWDLYENDVTNNDSEWTVNGVVINPMGATSGSTNDRVTRGSYWALSACLCGVSYRSSTISLSFRDPYCGIRLAQSIVP